jgi:hypothetical protein
MLRLIGASCALVGVLTIGVWLAAWDQQVQLSRVHPLGP